MERVKRRNINFSIKRNMQIRLLLKLLTVVLVSVGLTGAFFYLYSNRKIEDSFTRFHVQAESFLDYLLPAILIAILLGLLVGFIMILFFPHKIAGPLYRIERDLKEKVGEGDLTIRFKVRKGDEVEELAESINVMLDKMSARIGRIDSVTKELLDLLEGGDLDRDRLKEVAERLDGVVKEFKT